MRKTRTVTISKLFIAIIVFLFALIIGKLCYVGLSTKVDGIDLKAFASNRNTAEETLVATRGTIYDSKGEVLAQNVNSYTVIAYLDEERTTDSNHPEHVVDKERTAKELSPIINMKEKRILELLNTDAYQVELGPGGRGLTELVKEQIEDLDLPGISFIKSVKRYYPKASFLSYTLGYAKTDEEGNILGEMGIELYYDDLLKGINGKKIYQQDMYGYQIANTKAIVEETKSGSDVYLTIDTTIQLFVENQMKKLEEAKLDWATISITEAKTGKILAVASSPSFDPNIKNIKSYYDPFISYEYEPGSTMKTWSFMASDVNGIYNGTKKYKSGKITVDDYVISDWNSGYGWGKIKFDEGYIASSNVAATLLSQQLGRSKLTDFYNSLGFGSKTGITLPGEQEGKISFKYPSEIATASFGQGITITAVQMVQALTAIANDGMTLKPYIIDKIVDKDGNATYEGKRTEVNQVASPEIISAWRNRMRGVIDGKSKYATGTSYYVKGYDLIGKTGTAEIASSSGGYLSGYYDYIRSFTGLFPGDDPEVIIYIAASRIHDTKAIPNAVKELVQSIGTYLNLYSKAEIGTDADTHELDSYINKTVSSVKSSLKENNLKPIIIGSGDRIIKQYPSCGTKMNEEEKVFLLTNSTKYTMPNMKGWSRGDVTNYFNLINVPVTFEGYGYVTKTTPASSSEITSSSTVNVTLEPLYKTTDKTKTTKTT